MTQKIRAAHEKWRHWRAYKFVDECRTSNTGVMAPADHARRDSFLCGAQAEFEVARLVGKIEGFSEILAFDDRDLHVTGLPWAVREAYSKMKAQAESQLATLILAGEAV